MKSAMVLILAATVGTTAQAAEGTKAVMVIHGGAGTILKKNMTPETERAYRVALEDSLRRGLDILKKGGTSLSAVETAIKVMEDSPLFNAGKGAVFTHDGRNELDASIMDGKSRAAGAVAGVTIVKNPISAARAVMEKSPHVMMAGRGADLFATQQGLEIVDPSYFWTERRWKDLQRKLMEQEKVRKSSENRLWEGTHSEHKFGTVGAVAVDQSGNIAAGTSTGGTTNKRFGRVGDSPIIGAGTFADNESCAVSGTGDGEYFIRYTVAHDIAALVKYRGLSVRDAAREVVHKTLKNAGGEGGVIAIDRKGNFAMEFNSEGMYRGWIGQDGVPHVAIYREE